MRDKHAESVDDAFDFELTSYIHFNTPVDSTTAFRRVRSLAECFNLGQTKFSAGLPVVLPHSQIRITFTKEHDRIVSMLLYADGDLSRSRLESSIQAAAESLRDVAEPGKFELRDRDTSAVENSVATFWFGSVPEIDRAILIEVWHQAAEKLHRVGVAPDILMKMAQAGDIYAPAAEQKRRPRM